MSATMQALLGGVGPDWKLGEVEVPTPSPGQLLVRGEVAAALVPEVLPAVADGRIRPIVDTVVPIEDAQLAADRLRANQAVGKIVIEMPSTDPTKEDR